MSWHEKRIVTLSNYTAKCNYGQEKDRYEKLHIEVSLKMNIENWVLIQFLPHFMIHN